MRRLILSLLAALAISTPTYASPTGEETTHYSVEGSGPGRFVGAHGRRSSVMGYPATGLEVWAYPLQLASGYQIRFRESGRIEPFEGQALLSRIETSPSEVIRVYSGPDFVVREHVFVPLDVPCAIFTYEIEGRPDVQIEARFQASLDLMWPSALGGQEIAWNDARAGYVEREPLHGFSAIIRSAETVAHDATVNTATARPSALSLVMAPRRAPDGVRRAQLIVALDQSVDGAAATELASRYGVLRGETDAHYASVMNEAVEITTPDPDVNRGLASAIVAGEQAWACAPQIGCGIVGGYGPSRPGRRPQYAWFFAGDGLIAVEGFLAAGRYQRARDELEFIATYQNKSNGMIWHEMSTSASLIDWAKRYPYMFVHVDITLQYLSTLAKYVETTGDTAFVKTHWQGILAAWRYARGLVDPKTGLPSIPAGKQSQNEQAVLRDDVRMSASWIDASTGFASLARVHGDNRRAREGDKASQAAREAVRSHYWDEQSGFWFGGHTQSGVAIREQRPDAANVLLRAVFTDAQSTLALDRLAGPDFQTDWGMRSLSASHPDYDPNTYSSGAVWGLGSSDISTVFWNAHRPFTAWDAWHGLTAWTTLDSPGHLHEVVAGDLFHPELESVPEQTWSSAGFLSAAFDGLLGLEVHGATRSLTFMPHIPANWGEIGVKRLRVGSSLLDIHLTQDDGAITLRVDNHGLPTSVDFDPQIPLGAHLLGAEINGVNAPVSARQYTQDQHARVAVAAGHGVTQVIVRYSGGVRIASVETAPRVGDASVNVKLVSAEWLPGDQLKLKAFVVDPAHSAIDLFTPLKVDTVSGATVSSMADGHYRLTLEAPPHAGMGARTYLPVIVLAKMREQRSRQ